MQNDSPSRSYGGSSSRPIKRPESRLPTGYSPSHSIPPNYRPGNTLPPGYLPPQRDYQRTGAIVRDINRSKLNRRQILLLATGAGGLFIIVAIVATLVLNSLFVQTVGSPSGTIQDFYTQLKAGDYTHAFNQLAPATKASRTQVDFVNYYKQIDTLNGPITKFTVTNLKIDGTHATATVTATRNNDQRLAVDQIRLVLIDGTWYMESIVTENKVPTA